MEINATTIIDELMYAFDDIGNYHKQYSNKKLGVFYIDDSITANNPRLTALQRMEKSEIRLNTACWILRISYKALYATLLTARRWYNKTKWEKCLPDNDAERLLEYMVKQHTK